MRSTLFVNADNSTPPEVAYAGKLDTAHLMTYLRVLVSDSLEGRETGKPGQWRAASFLRSHFHELGLSVTHPDTLQYHPLSARANDGRNIKVRDEKYVFFQDYFFFSGLSDTNYTIDTLLFAGYGVPAEGVVNAWKNKPLIVLDGEPRKKRGRYQMTGTSVPSEWSTGYRKKADAILAEKPQLLIIIASDFRKIADSLLREEIQGSAIAAYFQSAGIPVIWVSEEMAEDILSRKRQNLTNNSFWSWSKMSVPVRRNTRMLLGANVPFLLKGSEKPEEVVVLTAHYDHLGIRDSFMYRGADDDGSGTAAVMELARVFSEAAANGYRPRRSILFMPVSGEEKGLLGSKFYCDHPVLPIEQTVVNVNTDMIGRTDFRHDSLGIRKYVYVIGSDRMSTDLHQINEEANNKHVQLKLDYTYNSDSDPNRYYYRSDHYNFVKKGVPAIFYFNGTHADYHKPTDTIDKIDPELMLLRSRLIFLTVWELANRKDRIRVNKKDTSR